MIFILSVINTVLFARCFCDIRIDCLDSDLHFWFNFVVWTVSSNVYSWSLKYAIPAGHQKIRNLKHICKHIIVFGFLSFIVL